MKEHAMKLDRDAVLLDNFRKSLDLYQTSLVWSMTASAVFFLLTVNLHNPHNEPIKVLYGELSSTAAWFVALGLFWILGILAATALGNTEAVLEKMEVEGEDRVVLQLYPSLATVPSRFIRIGAAIFSPIAVWIAFFIERHREPPFNGSKEWVGLIVFFLVTVGPYGVIAFRVWDPLSPKRNVTKEMGQAPRN
jgi:hypothetical protein